MEFHDELIKRGFSVLDSGTRTYGNGKLTGSIVFEKPEKGSIDGNGTIVDKKEENTIEIFCPFIKADDLTRPNRNFQTVRLRSLEDLDKYLFY